MLNGEAATRRFHLLDEITDQNDNIASAFVEFRFAKRACELLERSEAYARLSLETITKLRSACSFRMYKVGSALYGRRNPVWQGDVGERRKLPHVPQKTYANFADLRRRVLQPACAEIGNLAEFNL